MRNPCIGLGLLLLFIVNCGRQSNYDPTASSLALAPLHATADHEPWIGSVDPNNNPNNPAVSFEMLNAEPSVLISRPEYTLSWNSNTREINWASWLLEESDIGDSGRTTFSTDQDLEAYLAPTGEHAVSPGEYSGSCFDRGHQVPSGDRTANVEINLSVFKMSNLLPQTAFLNRTIWERLEARTRALLGQNRSTRLWVIAGPIFASKLQYIGTYSNIAVPTANFKIVIDLGSDDNAEPKLFTAVIMPNLTSKGTDPIADLDTQCKESSNLPSTHVDWQDYVVTLDEIEKQAGINLGPVRDRLANRRSHEQLVF